MPHSTQHDTVDTHHVFFFSMSICGITRQRGKTSFRITSLMGGSQERWLSALLVGLNRDSDRQPGRDVLPGARLLQAHSAQGSHHRRGSGRNEEHYTPRQGKEEHVVLDEFESERLIKDVEK
ncbi:hypothetical protein TNCT_444811 [Trichonephila clavata]|uniref:Uncharacterized protein n=1 Tax=Trichonephila clavata TaxID=2740835 RepID=A0A8X6KNI8_TRICU|nr:hypothetical protein TNCT_444811 [Trichonephila clavata]